MLHWTFLKSECIIGYIYKKIENKEYKLGVYNIKDDLQNVFGKYRIYLNILLFISISINLFIIVIRNNIKKYYLFIWYNNF